MKQIKLSPSTISLFLECPPLLLVAVQRGNKEARDHIPLAAGRDGHHTKEAFRQAQARPFASRRARGKFEGRLFDDGAKLEAWRSGYKGLRYRNEKTGSVLMGALDYLSEIKQLVFGSANGQ